VHVVGIAAPGDNRPVCDKALHGRVLLVTFFLESSPLGARDGPL
jgi:hypothetical protein